MCLIEVTGSVELLKIRFIRIEINLYNNLKKKEEKQIETLISCPQIVASI